MRLSETVNTHAGLKSAASTFTYHAPRNFVSWVSRRRWKIHGLEHIQSVQSPHGVILVSNHRSFFDMYIAATSLFAHASFIERLYFPVRSNFFYDNPLGAVVNFVMSGYAMWPPVFRDGRKARLNPIGLQQMAFALSEPGSVLGIHPEGARQKGPDPYVLGPARPGVGQLIEICHPETVVLPFFILGAGNNLLEEVRLRFRRDPGPDIRMRWSPPQRCADLRAGASGAQEIAERLLEIVHQLGEQDRRSVAARRP